MISEEAKEAIREKLNVFSEDVNQMTDRFWNRVYNDYFTPDTWEEIGEQIGKLKSELNSIGGLCNRFKQISADVSTIENMAPTRRWERANKKLAEEAAEIWLSGDSAKED